MYGAQSERAVFPAFCISFFLLYTNRLVLCPIRHFSVRNDFAEKGSGREEKDSVLCSTLSLIRNFHIPYLEAFEKTAGEFGSLPKKRQPSLCFPCGCAALSKKAGQPAKTSPQSFRSEKLLRREDFAVCQHTYHDLASAWWCGLEYCRFSGRLRKAVRFLHVARVSVFRQKTARPRLSAGGKALRPREDTLMVMNPPTMPCPAHRLYRRQLVHFNGWGSIRPVLPPWAPKKRLVGGKIWALGKIFFVPLSGRVFRTVKITLC